MSEEKKMSPELAEIITKAKELGVSLKKGISKLIAEIAAKLPKSEAEPPKKPTEPQAKTGENQQPTQPENQSGASASKDDADKPK